MPKKTKPHKSDRNRVNFNNPKTKLIVSTLALSENRATKPELLSLGNKDIFYQLKNSGFISEKENEKGMFCGTAKLHKHLKETEGKQFASSSSAVHSQVVRNSLKHLPQSVLVNGSYKTGTDINFQIRRIAKSSDYRMKVDVIRNELKSELTKAELERNRPCSTEEEHLRRELQYKAQKESILSCMDWLEQGCLTPDYQITLTQHQLNEYISNLANYREMLPEDSKAYEVYGISIDKLKSIPAFESNVTISVEIITNHYGERELFRHQLFETIEGHPQIFLI